MKQFFFLVLAFTLCSVPVKADFDNCEELSYECLFPNKDHGPPNSDLASCSGLASPCTCNHELKIQAAQDCAKTWPDQCGSGQCQICISNIFGEYGQCETIPITGPQGHSGATKKSQEKPKGHSGASKSGKNLSGQSENLRSP